jgi:hypothetical protein
VLLFVFVDRSNDFLAFPSEAGAAADGQFANRTAARNKQKNKSLRRRIRMSTGLAVFTLLQVALSVVGVLAGFVVVFGLISAQQSKTWIGTFRVTTAATSVTGFLFPFHKFLPWHALGIVSILVLALTIPALYVFRLAGAWRRVYVIGAVIALYLNVFVLIAQFFMKTPALKALAPTQSEAPFLGTQVAVMLIFIVLGVLATKRFPEQPVHAS